MPLQLLHRIGSPAAFLALYDEELCRGTLRLRAEREACELFEECRVQLSIAGLPEPVTVEGYVAEASAASGLTLLLPGLPQAVTALAERLRAAAAIAPPPPRAIEEAPAPQPPAPVERAHAEEPESPSSSPPSEPEARRIPPPPPTIAALLDTLGPTQKMRLAISGNREERLALLREINKIIHIYVLKNPRITLEEVQFAARQTNLSPDALKFIGDHAEWGSAPGVCAALVRNPKTPMDLALKMIERVGINELRAIARGAGRAPLVQAARRKLNV